MCEHRRRKRECKECGGAAICPHGRVKYYCKECGGNQAKPKASRQVCRHARTHARTLFICSMHARKLHAIHTLYTSHHTAPHRTAPPAQVRQLAIADRGSSEVKMEGADAAKKDKPSQEQLAASIAGGGGGSGRTATSGGDTSVCTHAAFTCARVTTCLLPAARAPTWLRLAARFNTRM